MLATGFIEADEYWRPIERLKQFGLETKAVPVNALHRLSSKKREAVDCEFMIDGHQRAYRSAGVTGLDSLVQISHGKGKLLVCPLPIELSKEALSARKAYVQAITVSKVPDWLLFSDWGLCISDALHLLNPRQVEDGQRVHLAFIDGDILAEYKP